MDRRQILDRIVDDGIVSVREHLSRPDQTDKLDGSVKGFEACRGLSDQELRDLLAACETAWMDARNRRDGDIEWFRWYWLQVEWTANCLSVWLMQQNQPVIVQPTARAALNVERILNSV